jgi:hypothetical protein
MPWSRVDYAHRSSHSTNPPSAIRRTSGRSIHLLRKAVTPGVAGDAAHSTLISVATYSP